MEAKLIEQLLKEWANRPSPELHFLMEISFKAGIREVVDWVNKQDNWRVEILSWLRKQKEWGIDG